VQEVNRMLAQFDQMQGMMKKMQKGGMAKLMRSLGGLAGMGKGGMPGGFGSSMPMPPHSVCRGLTFTGSAAVLLFSWRKAKRAMRT
jgi:hypothetical protein